MTYRSESAALDADILRTIDAWHGRGRGMSEDEFNDLALRLFAHQVRYDEPYARYCASFGLSESAPPASWREIPAIPTAAYKETALATFDPARAALTFETSGTTQGVGGRHYLETRALYDAALLAGFDHFVLGDGARLRYLNLVPDPRERPRSSLGYMMARVAAERGDGHTGWYLRGDTLLADAFVAGVRAAIADAVPICVAGTAFAFVNLLDVLAERGLRFALPHGSRLMETGGFKGRSRVVAREELYARICETFGIAPKRIVAEYGMTELTSQWYDVTFGEPRAKAAPPWLRARVVGADGKDLPDGVVGALVHVDLANRSSCAALLTEDLGALTADGLVLLGRERGAALRGCSLDAESLRAR